MPQRRPRKKGSFGTHFDELVSQFPHEQPTSNGDSEQRSAKLQEKLDIHRLLFEHAWQLERADIQRPATNSQIEKARSPAAGGS